MHLMSVLIELGCGSDGNGSVWGPGKLTFSLLLLSPSSLCSRHSGYPSRPRGNKATSPPLRIQGDVPALGEHGDVTGRRPRPRGTRGRHRRWFTALTSMRVSLVYSEFIALYRRVTEQPDIN